MSLLQDLISRRASTWEEAKKLNDEVEEAKRDFDSTEAERWDNLNEDLTKLDERISELVDLEDRNKAAEEARAKYGAPAQDGPSPAPDSDETKLRALATGQVRAVEFRGKLNHAEAQKRVLEKRDLVKGTTTAGGFTVPTDFLSRLYEHLIENSAIRQTNVTVLTTDSGEDLPVPKTTGLSTAVIVAEAGAIPESDPAFGQVTLQAFKYGILIQVARELLEDTGVDLIDFLSRQGGAALGNASGANFVTGTGSGQPNGVVTASTLGVTGGTGVAGAFTADNLIDLWASVIEPYASRGWWMFRRSSLGAIRKLKGSDNNYLWQPGLAGAVQPTLLDRPYVTDPNVAAVAVNAKSVIFGDLSAYYIRDVNSVRIERSDDFAFNTDLVTWRFLFRTDGDLIDTTGAVKHFVGAAT